MKKTHLPGQLIKRSDSPARQADNSLCLELSSNMCHYVCFAIQNIFLFIILSKICRYIGYYLNGRGLFRSNKTW